MVRRQVARKVRAPLNRDRVLRAAVEMADKTGIESLSMRKLGEAVGVEAMSLYNHVANKDDLLDGMVDMVFTEMDLPSSDVDWRAAMRQHATSAREVLDRHRWAIGLMHSRTSPGPATMRHFDEVLGCLRAAGFSVDMTGHAYTVITSYVYGFVLAFNQPHTAQAQLILERVHPGHYPYATEITAEYALRSGYDYIDEFEHGLQLILQSLGQGLSSPHGA